MTTSALRIASAQSVISTDVRRNGQDIRALMREASVAGARLAHFPEGALSGYAKSQIKDWSLDRNDPDWADHLAFARPWRSAARAGDIYTARRVRDTRSDNRTSF